MGDGIEVFIVAWWACLLHFTPGGCSCFLVIHVHSNAQLPLCIGRKEGLEWHLLAGLLTYFGVHCKAVAAALPIMAVLSTEYIQGEQGNSANQMRVR